MVPHTPPLPGNYVPRTPPTGEHSSLVRRFSEGKVRKTVGFLRERFGGGGVRGTTFPGP
jgi:hypothetical protein